MIYCILGWQRRRTGVATLTKDTWWCQITINKL